MTCSCCSIHPRCAPRKATSYVRALRGGPSRVSQADAKRKLKKAFCEPGNVEYNPPIALAVRIGLRHVGQLEVRRKPENGGDRDYATAAELVTDYASGALHPGDVKPALAKALNSILQPVPTPSDLARDRSSAIALRGLCARGE